MQFDNVLLFASWQSHVLIIVNFGKLCTTVIPFITCLLYCLLISIVLRVFACLLWGKVRVFACLSKSFCLFKFRTYAQIKRDVIIPLCNPIKRNCLTDMTTKIYKTKTPKVYKNKKLNNANFGTYNLNDYQVFLQLISKLGGIDAFGKYLQPEKLQREHTLTAKEFSNQFNVELDGAYTTLKRVAKKLTETSLTLEKPEIFETWHIALCSQAKYNHKEGSLTIKFTEEIMPYLAQVKSKFVLYNLKELANFGSLYSTRLYELIQEFKDTGFIIKSVEQLRDILVVGKKYTQYRDFKLYTFGHAVEEINSQYDIDLQFIEIKEGRAVKAVRFEFKPTFIRKGIDLTTGKERNIYLKPKQKPISAPKNQSQLTNLQYELTLPKSENPNISLKSISTEDTNTVITMDKKQGEQVALSPLELLKEELITPLKPRKKKFWDFLIK